MLAIQGLLDFAKFSSAPRTTLYTASILSVELILRHVMYGMLIHCNIEYILPPSIAKASRG